MGRQNILYIWAMGMWDNILSIPFFLKLREKWCKVTLLRYHVRYFWKHFHYVTDDVLNILKDNNLFDNILFVPYNKFKLLLFIFKNMFRFDCVYVPVKTFFSVLRARLLWKKCIIPFDSINDTRIYSGLVQWLLQDNTINSLFTYRKSLKIPHDLSYVNKYWIHWKFITIFPSIFERSIDAPERHKIISFLEIKWYIVVLIWWNREQWLYEDLKSYPHEHIINLCWKTNFKDIMNILTNSQMNISANGGIMRLGHLLNKYNISLHAVSWYITEPPVDNVHSFNIRKYSYSCEKPCESTCYRSDWIKGIPCCTFAWTEREAECRKSIVWEDIIFYLKKII